MPRTRQTRQIAGGYTFLEGPRWHDGRLYVSDFYSHQVIAVDADDTIEVICEVPNRPSGLGFTPDGSLLVVSMGDRRVLRLSDLGLVELANLSALAPGETNDMVVDRSGRAYVGNVGRSFGGNEFAPTTLVAVEPDGTAAVVAEDLLFPNGMAITPDGLTLLVAETFASRVTAFHIEPDGSLSGRRLWAALMPDAGRPVLADGLALDVEGALWVADASGSGPWRVREGGEVLERVDTGGLAVYAVALGGPARTTMFMCAGPPLGASDPATTRLAELVACEVDVPGAGLP